MMEINRISVDGGRESPVFLDTISKSRELVVIQRRLCYAYALSSLVGYSIYVGRGLLGVTEWVATGGGVNFMKLEG